MKQNKQLLMLACATVATLLLATLFESHLASHAAYILLGTMLGMLFLRYQNRPKLVAKEINLSNCPLDKAQNTQDGSACTVVVMKQYCYVIDTPVPQEVCFWYREEHQGRWDAQGGCCEAVVDGRRVCVRP